MICFLPLTPFSQASGASHWYRLLHYFRFHISRFDFRFHFELHSSSFSSLIFSTYFFGFRRPSAATPPFVSVSVHFRDNISREVYFIYLFHSSPFSLVSLFRSFLLDIFHYLMNIFSSSCALLPSGRAFTFTRIFDWDFLLRLFSIIFIAELYFISIERFHTVVAGLGIRFLQSASVIGQHTGFSSEGFKTQISFSHRELHTSLYFSEWLLTELLIQCF